MKCSRRDGYTLAEATAALVAAGLLTVGLATVLGLVARAAARYAEVTSAAESERIVPAVLGAELRALTAADATFDHDSVRLRAFRGGGIVCDQVGNELTVAWEGMRAPEAVKDSLLVVRGQSESAHRIEAVRHTVCGEREALALQIAAFVEGGERALVAYAFETGAYSFATSAFRYRRGAAGRQPLTAENLSARSRMTLRPGPEPSARLDLALVPEASEAAVVEWSVALPQARAATGDPP
ncbi:MAG TPA: hypothetical protein VF039_10055 [Longimicrobiales bacterium]